MDQLIRCKVFLSQNLHNLAHTLPSTLTITEIPSDLVAALALIASTSTQATPSGVPPCLSKYVTLLSFSVKFGLTVSISQGRKSSDRFKDDVHGLGTGSGYSKRTSSRGQFQRDSQSHAQRDPGRGSFPSKRGSTSSPTRKHGVGGSWSNDTGAWGSWGSSNEPGPSTSKSLDTSNQPSTNLLSGWGADDTSGGWGTSGNDPTNAWDSSGWGEDTGIRSSNSARHYILKRYSFQCNKPTSGLKSQSQHPHSINR